ncbi:hypothetical protein ACFW1A_30875 [Kitasatospora sp. NPDC058965]|uniref:hypothetical protein n=1 Tax=Kitasatospora sp. NPDC058965 TaxID=3346682 RepID=UPI0036C8B4F0
MTGAAACGCAVLGALRLWVDLTPDVVTHPSAVARTRLAQLRGDAFLTAARSYLGQPSADSTLECRDTPDGRRPPEVLLEYRGTHPDLSREKIGELATGAGWQVLDAGRTPTEMYSVNLGKSFEGWQSSAIVTVDPSTVTIELDASADDSCP